MTKARTTMATNGWCILRCAGRSTLPLAESLRAAGFDAWTPIEVQSRRLRRAGQQAERSVAIAPTFVFARADRIADLVRTRSLPVSPHPGFSIFQHAGRVPLIADREIAGLRAAEERARLAKLKADQAKLAPPRFEIGASVRTEQTAFAGLNGVVRQQRGRDVLVCFEGRLTVEISAWQVLPNPVRESQPALGAAA